MRKILTSIMVLSISCVTAYSADRYGNELDQADYGRSAALFRAPTLPVAIPTPSPTPSPTTLPNPVATTTTPAYGVDDCMNDISACVAATLPNGVNGLFNVDLRNSIINGMNLCGGAVDKCVNSATRLDGKKAYYAKNDVWIDFNSRVVQPQYYTLVLMKTGLTPNQAENTCLLLDKNTYGSSFTAVNSAGRVTTEYNNTVGAYNEQGGSKGAPMGSVVNKKGAVDSERGHYARWDATTGTCLVRVAAYNKDDLISNEWFFGGIGDKTPAEVWKNAGESFGCNKDTFGFALKNNTKTVALAAGIGVVAGAGIGAGIGALTAHDKVANTEVNLKFCGDEAYRDLLARTLDDMGEKQEFKTADDCQNYMKEQLLFAQEADGTFNKNDKGKSVEARMKELNGIGKGKGAGKGALIGAGSMLAAGGVATAITAFVESKNITCHVGDGLDTVGFGKNGRVKSLKEYYVEWALNLPDTVSPIQTVTECNSWNTACNSISNINDCTMAVITYKPEGSKLSTQVETACTVSGSTCVANNPVAVSYGACM